MISHRDYSSTPALYSLSSHLKTGPFPGLEVSNREMKISEEGRIMKRMIDTLP